MDTYDVVWNGDIHGPRRGLLNVVPVQTRRAPRLRSRYQAQNVQRCGVRGPVVLSAAQDIQRALKSGTWTTAKLASHLGYSRWRTWYLLRALIDDGLPVQRAMMKTEGCFRPRAVWWIAALRARRSQTSKGSCACN